jgi:hypothetical protein
VPPGERGPSPWANKGGTHGGKRRRHVSPALSWADVLDVRKQRALGVPEKVLMRKYNVGRTTITTANNGTGAYADYK